MNDVVREWVTKAEADYRTSRRELEAPEEPNFDAVCFHAQQCIEKLMKALLVHRSILPPKTHDLLQLDQLLAGIAPQWALEVKDLRFLTRAAVEFRYPGESADRAQAEEAFAICTRLRRILRDRFDEALR